jgi:hypothetical protein
VFHALRVVGEIPFINVTGIPFDQDVPKIEDDGFDV